MPEFKISVPRGISSPFFDTFFPGTKEEYRETSSSIISVSSILVTASEPSGITAPVEILIASPDLSTRLVCSPISIVPIFFIILGLLGDAPNVSSALTA
ncbi:hypothetical protein ES705_21991 [subsurface metagenome]